MYYVHIDSQNVSYQSKKLNTSFVSYFLDNKTQHIKKTHFWSVLNVFKVPELAASALMEQECVCSTNVKRNIYIHLFKR